jgi:hypothetical protein
LETEKSLIDNIYFNFTNLTIVLPLCLFIWFSIFT